MDNSSFNHETINYICFNVDNTCLAMGTSRGFKVYSTDPFMLKQERDFGAPIQIIEMINRSNLLALVGSKDTPFSPPNKLVIFDDGKPFFIQIHNALLLISLLQVQLNLW